MSNKIQKIAREFLKKNHLINVNYDSLCDAVTNEGYTVIEFNSLCNDGDVGLLIDNLNLGNKISKSRGFVFVNDNFRLIFINEELNDEEKKLVISHETGHIVCNHMTSGTFIGKDVREEYEANEFVHYLLKKQPFLKMMINCVRHKYITAVTMLAVVALLLVSVNTIYHIHNSKFYRDCYVTPSGTKYHREECMYVKDNSSAYRLSKEDFKSGEYKPCSVCFPDE